MTVADSFLQTILATPTDDTVRLVYADWLEERGDPRAEFIRLQIELKKYAPGKRPTALTQREHALAQTHGRDWAGELADLVENWLFDRGFVDTVTIRTQDFVAIIEQVVALAPIAHLKLRYDPKSALPPQFASDTAVFGTEPPLHNILSLDLASNLLDDWDVRTLGAWTSLDQLRVLDLSDNRIGDKGVRALAAAEVFPRLVELNLSENPITADGIRALEDSLSVHAERGQGPRLQQLELRGDQLSASARQELGRTRFLRRVANYDRPTSALSNSKGARPNR